MLLVFHHTGSVFVRWPWSYGEAANTAEPECGVHDIHISVPMAALAATVYIITYWVRCKRGQLRFWPSDILIQVVEPFPHGETPHVTCPWSMKYYWRVN